MLELTINNLSTKEERLFKSLVHENPETKCWDWIGNLNLSGYGVLYMSRLKRTILAHRLSFVLHHGPLVPRMVIDHICVNRKCVNPAHLRQVTYLENNTENKKPRKLRLYIPKEDKEKALECLESIEAILSPFGTFSCEKETAFIRELLNKIN